MYHPEGEILRTVYAYLCAANFCIIIPCFCKRGIGQKLHGIETQKMTAYKANLGAVYMENRISPRLYTDLCEPPCST